MTLTNAPSRPTAALTAILSAVALLIALVGAGNQPARADKFTPLEDPPTISIETDAVVVTPSGILGDDMDPATDDGDDTKYDSFSAFQPAFNGSDEIYNVFATITSNADDWQDNITRVRLCIYEPDAIGALVSPDNTVNDVCGFELGGLAAFTTALGDLPHKDPRDILVIEWNAEDHTDSDLQGFTVLDDGDNQHSNVESRAAFLSTSTNEGLIRFSFKVSHAMQESDDWEIRVAVESQPPSFDTAGEVCEDPEDGSCTAQDPQSGTDISGTSDTPVTYPVAYFGSMTTARDDTVNFGVVRFGEVVTRTEIPSGAYVANAVSSLIIQATDFTNEDGATVTVPLAETGDLFDAGNEERDEEQDGDTTTWAGDNTVSLDCKFDDTESLDLDSIRTGESPEYAGWLQVGNFARVFATGKEATGESSESLDAHACALTYGGGAERANVVFSNQVDLGVMKSASGSDTFGDEVDFPAQSGGDVSIAANDR